jgi:Spy/CpxP family protein refolding chaperone
MLLAVGLVFLLCQNGFSVGNKILDQLQLSVEQKNKITAINDELKEKKKELTNTLVENRIELRKILKNNEMDKDAIKEKLKQIAIIESEIKFLQYDQIIEIEKILTENQNKLFRKLIVEKANTVKNDKKQQKKTNLKQKMKTTHKTETTKNNNEKIKE